MEVARLVAEGLADKEIAAILVIHIGTAKRYIDRIAKKLGLDPTRNRRTGIARYVERIESPPRQTDAAA